MSDWDYPFPNAFVPIDDYDYFTLLLDVYKFRPGISFLTLDPSAITN